AVDVFHVTTNRGLPLRHVCKYVLTCHDVIDRLPEYCDGDSWRSALRKKYADFAARHSADKYITVSEFSKRDICRFHRLPPERVSVVYNGVSERFYQKAPDDASARVRERYKLPRKYFLFIAGFDKRKNAGALVEAYAQLPHDAPPLVLIGEQKWGYA